MSNSRQKRAARTRMSYTGERYEAALAGISRDLTCDLDSCTPRQRQLNSILALGIFNRGDEGAPPKEWGISTLTWYTITVSPRWNKLVFIAHAPMNVAQYLVLDKEDHLRVPGIRARSTAGWNFALEYIPTGAQVHVTSRPSGNFSPDPHRRDRFLSADTPLFPGEVRQIADLPEVADHAQTLLGALLARMSVGDPGQRWATGNWYWDPLERAGHTEIDDYNDPQRRLWGADDEWELQWSGYPYVDDVAQALTDSVIGVPDAKLSTQRNGYEVTLNGSVLKIRR